MYVHIQSCKYGYIHIHMYHHVSRSLYNWWAALNIVIQGFPQTTSFCFNKPTSYPFFTCLICRLAKPASKNDTTGTSLLDPTEVVGSPSKAMELSPFRFGVRLQLCETKHLSKHQESLLKKRWVFVNVEISASKLQFETCSLGYFWSCCQVWRNVAETPVECFPLAACDAKSLARSLGSDIDLKKLDERLIFVQTCLSKDSAMLPYDRSLWDIWTGD